MADTSECVWTSGRENPFAFQTACGHAFRFYEGSPAESGFIFCPYCGSQLFTDHEPLSISNDKTEGRESLLPPSDEAGFTGQPPLTLEVLADHLEHTERRATKLERKVSDLEAHLLRVERAVENRRQPLGQDI